MRKLTATAKALRRLSDRRLNGAKRKLGIGSYWRWMPPGEIPEHVDTMSMIFPLRYDVMIRKGFFDLYSDLRERGAQRDEIVTAAKEHEYHAWFEHIMVTRNAPQLLGDDAAIARLFEQRVDDNIALFDSLSENGFDERFPIMPYASERVRFARPDRTTTAKFFAGDGCHRIAALLALGYTEIPGRFLRPKMYNRLTPLDNTLVIAEVVAVPPEWLPVGLGPTGSPTA